MLNHQLSSADFSLAKITRVGFTKLAEQIDISKIEIVEFATLNENNLSAVVAVWKFA